ncbi:MAG: hypothetical protein K2X44_10960, partial [Magnetospirillum sp.]|nr:hypothetical protein [Magnetospirillum sp.]
MSTTSSFAITIGDYLLRRKLKHLIVHVTNHCNFRCEHCFIDFSPKRDMKLEQFAEIARDAGKLFWLDIGGGEPSLRKDLADIVGLFSAKVVHIPTNGALLPQLVEQMSRMREKTDAELIV